MLSPGLFQRRMKVQPNFRLRQSVARSRGRGKPTFPCVRTASCGQSQWAAPSQTGEVRSEHAYDTSLSTTSDPCGALRGLRSIMAPPRYPDSSASPPDRRWIRGGIQGQRSALTIRDRLNPYEYQPLFGAVRAGVSKRELAKRYGVCMRTVYRLTSASR